MSPHLSRIRSLVGHELLMLPSVAVLPRDAAGRVLLVRQVDLPGGEWATIGGAVEADEAPEDAARREVLEEVGVDVKLGGIAAAVGGPAMRVRYPNGDLVSYVTIAYEATVVDVRIGIHSP